MAVESWAPISSGTPARPSLPTTVSECWVGRPGRGRHTVQGAGPTHSATVRFCLSCLAPQGAFRLVRPGQVASCMHHPDTPLAPSPINRALSHPGHLDHPPIPPSTGQSLARPPSSNKHPLRSLLIPPLFFPYFYHHLPPPISAQPLRTLPTLPGHFPHPTYIKHTPRLPTTVILNHLRLRKPKAIKSDKTAS